MIHAFLKLEEITEVRITDPGLKYEITALSGLSVLQDEIIFCISCQ